MKERVFLDTNILIYAALQPDVRSDVARGLLGRDAVFSIQVLNEFANVGRRKLHRSWPEIERALAAIRAVSPPPLPMTLATHTAALRLAERTGYQIDDALILASALSNDCTILLSEDFQEGQVIDERLTIRNPFKALPAA